MMHRCSSSHVGPCSCGLFNTQTNTLSMLFSMPSHQYNTTTYDMYSSVDCTLSLGTPSTRLTEDGDDNRGVRHDRHPSSSASCMSNFCWDIFPNKNATYYPTASHSCKSNTSRGNNNNSNNSLSSNDPLLARRRCANCDTTSTPLWRNGPRGPKSLCNACGIRFKKEERRASAANANSGSGKQSGSGMDYGYQSNSTWVQSQKMARFSSASDEFRFVEDNDRDSDSGIPFLSWRLNVTDRPGLVHDFTR